MKLKWLAPPILLLVGAFAMYLVWLDWLGRRYDPVIRTAAERYGLDPALVKAVVWRESRFDPSARGRAGELGLMQIGEDAAIEWAGAEGIKNFQHEHCVDPGTNTMAATWYLKKALARYSHGEDDPVPYALAEYNAGRKHVLRWKTGAGETNGVVFAGQIGFPSTSNYVFEIMSRRDSYVRDFQK